MFSLIFYGVTNVILYLFQALAMAWAARKVGSQRRRFKFALFASAVIFVATVAGFVFIFVFEPLPPDFSKPHFDIDPITLDQQQRIQTMRLMLATALVEFAITYLVTRVVFKLSAVRALAPFGAMIAVQVIAVILASLLMKPYVSEAFIMPTRGMSPTVDAGDHFMVSKLTALQRFDLVTYHAGTEGHPIYLKRLIALPGERLRFDDGDIYINNQKVDAPKVLTGKCHATIDVHPQPQDLYRDGQTITLANDEYFFLGDNIEISMDSRWQGPTQRSAIIGVVDVIYWPVSKMRIVR